MIANGVNETGRYDDEAEAVDLINDIGPAMILLPSIWPETFCYVLSTAFRLGIPPVVFDIGAPADRIRAAGFGFVLPYGLIDDIRGLNDRLRALPVASTSLDRSKFERTTYPNMLQDYYGISGH